MTLLGTDPSVVTAGVGLFADALERQAARVVRVAWTPPIAGTEGDLAVVMSDARRAAANAEALRRVGAARALLVDVLPARDALGLADRQMLHAGPPIEWERACGPLRGALMGAAVLEGLVDDPAAAVAAFASGEVSLAPCHHYGAVGPMAGVLSASMWVWVLEDADTGHRTYCSLNEGLGKVLRYGAYSADVLQRLRWMATVLGPALQSAVRLHGPVDVTAILAQMVQMGDEAHNRNRAGTLMLLRDLTPALLLSGIPSGVLADVIRFIGGNDHFFLNLAMPACKLALDSARDIPSSTMVVAMCRNGTDFGIQVAGTGNEWFIGPAQLPDGLYLGNYGPQDASPDIGDSAITETAGLGGFALAAAPAIVQFIGGTAPDAVTSTRRMYEITTGEHPAFGIPALDFRGAPLGIDVTRVIRTGILPNITTGIAGRIAGTGQVGAGLVKPPPEVFTNALQGLAARVPAAHLPPPPRMAGG